MTFHDIAEGAADEGHLCLRWQDVDVTVDFALNLARTETKLEVHWTYFTIPRYAAYAPITSH